MRRVIKKMLPCVLGASMMLTGVNAPVSASSFRDTQGHWGQAAIDKWNGFGVVHGYAGAFRPGSSVTRAEFAVMMDNIMKYIEQEEQGFADVDGSKWYYDAMMKLATAGVMKGGGRQAVSQPVHHPSRSSRSVGEHVPHPT
ncbi:S-layer homology domain-containing protein [Paenibacillus thiaminolyticus]|nr:S-layer homology domain-containing protein [Paenibacillus thiaminolyticus]